MMLGYPGTKLHNTDLTGILQDNDITLFDFTPCIAHKKRIKNMPFCKRAPMSTTKNIH